MRGAPDWNSEQSLDWELLLRDLSRLRAGEAIQVPMYDMARSQRVGWRALRPLEQRAVLVYQMESYRYWQERLGRADFVAGQFGENFTVEGLADTEVCIGDHYRIGDALFEVTQPRVTCYRVGIRMNEPQMAALLVSHPEPAVLCKHVVDSHSERRADAGERIDELRGGNAPGM